MNYQQNKNNTSHHFLKTSFAIKISKYCSCIHSRNIKVSIRGQNFGLDLGLGIVVFGLGLGVKTLDLGLKVSASASKFSVTLLSNSVRLNYSEACVSAGMGKEGEALAPLEIL